MASLALLKLHNYGRYIQNDLELTLHPKGFRIQDLVAGFSMPSHCVQNSMLVYNALIKFQA